MVYLFRPGSWPAASTAGTLVTGLVERNAAVAARLALRRIAVLAAATLLTGVGVGRNWSRRLLKQGLRCPRRSGGRATALTVFACHAVPVSIQSAWVRNAACDPVAAPGLHLAVVRELAAVAVGARIEIHRWRLGRRNGCRRDASWRNRGGRQRGGRRLRCRAGREGARCCRRRHRGRNAREIGWQKPGRGRGLCIDRRRHPEHSSVARGRVRQRLAHQTGDSEPYQHHQEPTESLLAKSAGADQRGGTALAVYDDRSNEQGDDEDALQQGGRASEEAGNEHDGERAIVERGDELNDSSAGAETGELRQSP